MQKKYNNYNNLLTFKGKLLCFRPHLVKKSDSPPRYKGDTDHPTARRIPLQLILKEHIWTPLASHAPTIGAIGSGQRGREAIRILLKSIYDTLDNKAQCCSFEKKNVFKCAL